MLLRFACQESKYNMTIQRLLHVHYKGPVGVEFLHLKCLERGTRLTHHRFEPLLQTLLQTFVVAWNTKTNK